MRGWGGGGGGGWQLLPSNQGDGPGCRLLATGSFVPKGVDKEQAVSHIRQVLRTLLDVYVNAAGGHGL